MDALLKYPVKDGRKLDRLREALKRSPRNGEAAVALGTALFKAGCTHEAAFLLRPLKKTWQGGPHEESAQACLALQAWFNKHQMAFVRARSKGDAKGALKLLGERWRHCWDNPSLLMHFSALALDRKHGALSNHVLKRVYYLSQRGIPNLKFKLDAFEYASQSCLIENMLHSGEAQKALRLFRKLKPNFGNAMAHEILEVELLVANKCYDEAMKSVARMAITATQERTGYSKKIRLDFIKNAKELGGLRKRGDWKAMLADPATYLKDWG